jgi:hypothetical protein
MIMRHLGMRLGAVGVAVAAAAVLPLVAATPSFAALAGPPGTYKGSTELVNYQDHDCLWGGTVTQGKSVVVELKLRGCGTQNVTEEWGLYKQARYVSTAYMLQIRSATAWPPIPQPRRA